MSDPRDIEDLPQTEEPLWPPPTYYTTGTPIPAGPKRRALVTPLDESPNHVLRYQLPEAPVEPGLVFVEGYLRASLSGDLLDTQDKVVGKIDFDSGIFTIERSKSPTISRFVEYVYPRRVRPPC